MKVLPALAAGLLFLPLSALSARAAPPAAPASNAARAPAPKGARAPVPLDGVVAIVDDVVFFRSDVIGRLKRLDAKLAKDPAERRDQQAELVKMIIGRLIDEVLVNKDAAKLHIEVSDADVDRGVDMVASQNKVDRKVLEAEVKDSGYTLPEYRDELRKQILEEKWLLVRAAGKIDRTKAKNPADIEVAFENQRKVLLAELRSHAFIELR